MYSIASNWVSMQYVPKLNNGVIGIGDDDGEKAFTLGLASESTSASSFPSSAGGGGAARTMSNRSILNVCVCECACAFVCVYVC